MKKLILIITVMISCIGLSAQTQKKVLVAYFSATGNTESVAKTIAKAIDGTLFSISPKVAYTAADLNWRDKGSRSSMEMNDVTSRPELLVKKLDVNSYDVIFIGFPIWWNLAPRIINSFLDTYNLNGKKVIPFVTSGSSSIDNSVKVLKSEYPNIKWENGTRFGTADKTISNWAIQQM